MAGALAISIARASRRFLAAGKNANAAISKFRQTDFGEGLFSDLVKVPGMVGANSKLHCGQNRLGGGEFVVGDAELRDIADFGGRKIFIREVPAIPDETTFFVAISNPRHDSEKSAFPATRGTDDGGEVLARDAKINVG